MTCHKLISLDKSTPISWNAEEKEEEREGELRQKKMRGKNSDSSGTSSLLKTFLKIEHFLTTNVVEYNYDNSSYDG